MLDKIEGIAFRGTGRDHCADAPREQINDIDAQPWPAREAIDIGRYMSKSGANIMAWDRFL